MVKELKEMGVETVVSVWPTVDERSHNYSGFMSRYTAIWWRSDHEAAA